MTAVGEIIGNIARHAHPPSTHETLDVRLRLFPGHVEARFLDTGIPFVPRPHAEPDAEPGIDALTEGGRGLALIRAAVDELHYDRLDGSVNRWRLIKHIR